MSSSKNIFVINYDITDEVAHSNVLSLCEEDYDNGIIINMPSADYITRVVKCPVDSPISFEYYHLHDTTCQESRYRFIYVDLIGIIATHDEAIQKLFIEWFSGSLSDITINGFFIVTDRSPFACIINDRKHNDFYVNITDIISSIKYRPIYMIVADLPYYQQYYRGNLFLINVGNIGRVPTGLTHIPYETIFAFTRTSGSINRTSSSIEISIDGPVVSFTPKYISPTRSVIYMINKASRIMYQIYSGGTDHYSEYLLMYYCDFLEDNLVQKYLLAKKSRKLSINILRINHIFKIINAIHQWKIDSLVYD